MAKREYIDIEQVIFDSNHGKLSAYIDIEE